MPSSVGMQRTARVFGVVKGADGARVLRSGRMLWPYSCEAKLRKGSDRDDWSRSMIAGDGNKRCRIGYDMGDDRDLVNGSGYGVSKQNMDARDATNLCAEKSLLDKMDEYEGKHQDYGVAHGAKNEMFGIVYGRKRKDIHGVVLNRKKYGNCYHRRNKRQKKDVTAGTILGHRRIAIIKHGSSREGNVFGHFLYSVLRYIKTVGIQLTALARFVMSEPLYGVYFSGGMELSQDSSSILGAGFCIISGTQEHSPSFWVDFSAVPSSFVFLHCELLLRHLYMPLAFEHNSAPHQIDGSSFVENAREDEQSFPAQKTDSAPSVDNPASQFMLLLPASGSKMETCPSQCRHGNSLGIRKRRSSLRSKQGRNRSFSGSNNCNGMLPSELIGTTNSGHPFSSTLSGKKTWRSSRMSSAGYVYELNSAPSLSQEVGFASCTANLLTTQFHQCIHEGVSITLEPSSSGECSLVIKKGGVARFMYKALEVTKPWVPNSASQSMVWAGDNGWKLEFPDKGNWLKFKDLSKECIERNKQLRSPRPSSTKIIPIPHVCEVLGYEKDQCRTFFRPDSYIVSDGDELSRAMTSKGSSYDMDSEDEEWLNVYNRKFLPKSWVSDESFERLIDVFEKDFYCNPRDTSYEKPVTEFRMENVSKDALVAVYSYWTKKRKNKRSALVRVFQGHQPRKAFVPRSVFRKRRSFKRQPSQHGRGSKQPGFLQAMKTERDALEEQAAMHKVEEARAFANSLAELAINKRHRAQSLTENADLAAYRATMALRLAEAAQVMEPPIPELLHHIINLHSESANSCMFWF